MSKRSTSLPLFGVITFSEDYWASQPGQPHVYREQYLSRNNHALVTLWFLYIERECANNLITTTNADARRRVTVLVRKGAMHSTSAYTSHWQYICVRFNTYRCHDALRNLILSETRSLMDLLWDLVAYETMIWYDSPCLLTIVFRPSRYCASVYFLRLVQMLISCANIGKDLSACCHQNITFVDGRKQS